MLRHIASGGFGDVWLAKKPKGSGKLAIKLIRPELLADTRLVRRFEREIILCSALKHPGIVPITFCGRTPENVPYFVMPYIEGQTLRAALKSQGRMNLARALSFFFQITDALASAHRSDIIHRDIKSSNILIDKNDKAYVADFGLAKLLDNEGPNLTRSLEVIGTPACMAPEQARGDEVDKRTDIYSLGILLYELLSGALPFANSSMAVLAQLHCYAERPSLLGRDDVPNALNDVIGKSMEVNPDKRYQSIEDLVRAVRAACAGQSDTAQECDRYLLLHLEDIKSLAEDCEDTFDEFLDEIEAFHAMTLVRSGRRLALIVPANELSTSDLESIWHSDVCTSSLSMHSRLVQMEDITAAGKLLNEPWPAYTPGLHQDGALNDSETVLRRGGQK